MRFALEIKINFVMSFYILHSKYLESKIGIWVFLMFFVPSCANNQVCSLTSAIFVSFCTFLSIGSDSVSLSLMTSL
jgi:hypothetical protein